MKLRLSYDNGLVVTPIDMSVGELRRDPVWKIRLAALRHYGPCYRETDVLYLLSKDDPSVKKIMGLLDAAGGSGVECQIDSTLADDLTAREEHLREKARVGLLIKAHDRAIMDRFQEFCTVEGRLTVRPLKERQLWDAFFMSTMGRSANFSVPGSGKTASVLGAFAFLRERGLVDRLIVVSPKNAFGSWRDEWAACFGPEHPARVLCFHDPEFAGTPTGERSRILKLDYKRYDMILVNYESVRLGPALALVAADRALLVFDEVHKVKRVGGTRAKSAVKVARKAPYFVALTGTPIPNSYEDLYNLLHCLWLDDYSWYFGLDKAALKDADEMQAERINDAIAPFFCRTNKVQLGVPSANEDDLVDVPVDAWEQNLFGTVVSRLSGEPFEMIVRLLQLESDPHMLEDRLLGDEVAELLESDSTGAALVGAPITGLAIPQAPTAKMKACLDLVERLTGQGKTVIVWCIFRKSISNIVRGLAARRIKAKSITGSTDMEARGRIVDDFKQGQLKVLVTNPHTLAESVSLHSVCHDAVYFECSYNLVHLLQSKDRIHRLGLSRQQYTQYHFLRSVYVRFGDVWSLDRNIYERLQYKERLMLDSIDRGFLEPGYSDERDLELVFKGLFDDDDRAKGSSKTVRGEKR